MVKIENTENAAMDSIFGKETPRSAAERAFSKEAQGALNNAQAQNNLTIRMAQNVYDCYPTPLTAELLQKTLGSAQLKAKVELIRKGNEKHKASLPCIFWQGTLDISRYAEANRISITRGEHLPSAVNKDKYFTLATPFCFIDIDQPHEPEATPFDAFVLYGKIAHQAPQGEMVFVQQTARKGLRIVVKRNDTESLQQIQHRYGGYANRPVDVLLDYTRRSFLTSIDDVFLMDLDEICKPFSMEDSLKWKALDDAESSVIQSSHSVIQSEAKNLEDINVEAHEILRRYAPLNDNGISEAATVATIIDEMLGGSVGEGGRHNRYMRILGYMRHLCPTAEALVASCGYEELPLEERMRAAADVVSQPSTREVPRLLTDAISAAQAKLSIGETLTKGEEPKLPARLPKPLQILTKKVHPLLYPCVIRSAFAAFATHLEGVRVRYENGTENELPFVHLCVAPQGSGKSSIIAPSDAILQSILTTDLENRLREAEWKKAKAMGETGIERPADLAVQVLSSDCTAAAFNQKLADAAGRYLYMRMDELEGLRKMAGSVERATEILRLAFDASVYGQERVGAESVTTRCTLRLNLVASTTPITAQKFFKNATQDGTLTRIGLSTINNPDKVRWHYGSYDERYREALSPYIERLKQQSGLITCTAAEKEIRLLIEQMEDKLSVSGQEHLLDYVYRAGIIAFRESLLLYMMTGKWSRDIAEYMAWSLEYQLWVMDKVFGRQIRLSHEAAQEAERNIPLVKNLLTDMAETFTADDLKRHFISLGKKPSAVGNYLRQQLHRKNLSRHGEAYRKTERFKQRYEG
ncbi:MAG: DUF3987 domain-containing protein [Bacteroides sp.]|nr:DUF3987 domain-containing protein [Bacteroides sp.]